MRIESINFGQTTLEAYRIHNVNATILLIKAPNGALGCGYFDINTANKCGDVMSVVRGVASFDDMMNATVQEVSENAAKLGVTPGITGREALEKMC